jgi:hypothetical protein
MLTHLLLASWIAGLFVPILVTALFFNSIDWEKQLTGPTWDFTRSWASNMTAAGTILSSTVVLSWIAPNANLRFLPRQGYLVIASISGGLAVLAPLTFNVMSRIFQACRQHAAFSIAFLISAGITIWGLTLQLSIGACLAWELYAAKMLPRSVAVGLVTFVVTLSILVVWYAVLTAKDTLNKEARSANEAVGIRELQSQRPTPTPWALL